MERTIPRLVRAAVEDVPDKIWLVTEEREQTYADALGPDRAGRRLAAGGRRRRGDRVLVTARNTDLYLLTWLALMEVGAIEVPLNPQSTEAELQGFVEQVRPSAIVTDAGLATTVDAAVASAGDRATAPARRRRAVRGRARRPRVRPPSTRPTWR